jgi:hypothetical protein
LCKPFDGQTLLSVVDQVLDDGLPEAESPSRG